MPITYDEDCHATVEGDVFTIQAEMEDDATTKEINDVQDGSRNMENSITEVHNKGRKDARKTSPSPSGGHHQELATPSPYVKLLDDQEPLVWLMLELINYDCHGFYVKTIYFNVKMYYTKSVTHATSHTRRCKFDRLYLN